MNLRSYSIEGIDADLFVARGLFFDAVFSLESMINDVIIYYFKVPEDRVRDFQTGVLGELNARKKYEVLLKKVIANVKPVTWDESGEPTGTRDMTDTLARIRAVYQFRNLLAHGALFRVGGDDIESLVRKEWAIQTLSMTEEDEGEPISKARLADEIERANLAFDDVFALFSEVSGLSAHRMKRLQDASEGS